MKKRLSFSIGVFVSSLLLTACSSTSTSTHEDDFFAENRQHVSEQYADATHNRGARGAKAKLNTQRHGVMAESIETEGQKTFIFNPEKLAWGAYDENGELIRYGRASGGNNWCADVGRPCRTTVGEFEIYRKGNANCKSSKYPKPNGGAPMPYCMFFHGGMAIHGSNDVPDHNASHGCVRVPKADAEWLHKEFLEVGTKVHVHPYES